MVMATSRDDRRSPMLSTMLAVAAGAVLLIRGSSSFVSMQLWPEAASPAASQDTYQVSHGEQGFLAAAAPRPHGLEHYRVSPGSIGSALALLALGAAAATGVTVATRSRGDIALNKMFGRLRSDRKNTMRLHAIRDVDFDDVEKELVVAAAVVSEKVKVTGKMVKELRERSRAGIMDCQNALKDSDGDMELAMAWLKKKGVAKADKKAGNVAVEGGIASYVHFNNKIAVIVEVNCETDFAAGNEIFKEFASDVAMQIAANPSITCVTTDDVPADVVAKEKAVEMSKEDLEGKPDNIKEKIVDGRLRKRYEEMALMNQKWLKDEDFTVQEMLKQRISKLGENIVIRRFSRLTLGEGLEKKDADFAAGVEKELEKYRSANEAPAAPAPAAEAPKEEKKDETPKPKADAPKVAVSAAQVKELRQRSGAGILDSKKALGENGGDMEKAMEWLKKKGIAKADKKAGNEAVEGAIASYIHFNRKLGVIVEVNSETDFVAQNAIFKEFTSDVAMQIAANPTVVAVSVDDLDPEVRAKEKATEMAKEDLAGKPEDIKEKIVEGRLRKKFEDLCLMSQKWLKDEDKSVQDVLKEKIAKLGENLIIRRFERLTLGEGLEKADADFAAGVEKELEKYRQ